MRCSLDVALAIGLSLLARCCCRADTSTPRRRTHPRHASVGSIVIDGSLNDPAWHDDTFHDVVWDQPADNVPPPLGTRPTSPSTMRRCMWGLNSKTRIPAPFVAPLGDHDHLNGNSMDYGVILDTRDDGHSAVLLLVNASGVQYDAVTDDQGRQRRFVAGLLHNRRRTSTITAGRSRCACRSRRCAITRPIRRIGASSLYRNYPRATSGIQ